MDGIAATAEIRRLLGSLCPPVVAMTAYSMQEDAGRFMRQGLDDYVGKPVKSRHLYEVLHRWLRPRPGTPPGAGAGHKAAEPLLRPEPAPVTLEPAGPVAPATSEPTLDDSILRQLVELGGAEFTIDLYREFEQEVRDLLRDAAPLAAAAQFNELLPMLHQLKGTAATLGGAALAAQARLLEHQFKAGDTEEGAAGFQLLEHYFAQFVAEYPAAVKRTI